MGIKFDQRYVILSSKGRKGNHFLAVEEIPHVECDEQLLVLRFCQRDITATGISGWDVISITKSKSQTEDMSCLLLMCNTKFH